MKIRALLLASATCALSLSAPAYADTAPAPGDDDTRKDIIVTAPRQEEKARETQRDASNIINVQSAEAIAKYPDFNAAEALSRVPGVSLSSDTGEGRFVVIRGIDGNLNGATYGGVVLLNTNPAGTVFGSGRAVEFDTGAGAGRVRAGSNAAALRYWSAVAFATGATTTGRPPVRSCGRRCRSAGPRFRA